jgi:hypothetical protein
VPDPAAAAALEGAEVLVAQSFDDGPVARQATVLLPASPHSESDGTFVNEERLESGVLRDGEVIRLGRIKIAFVAEPSSISAAAAPGAAIVGSTLSDTTLSGDIIPGSGIPLGFFDRKCTGTNCGHCVYRRTFVLISLDNHFIDVRNGFLDFNIQYKFFSGSQILIIDAYRFISKVPYTDLDPAGLNIFKPEITVFIRSRSLNGI